MYSDASCLKHIHAADCYESYSTPEGNLCAVVDKLQPLALSLEKLKLPMVPGGIWTNSKATKRDLPDLREWKKLRTLILL
jgi:hypothetical protein